MFWVANVSGHSVYSIYLCLRLQGQAVLTDHVLSLSWDLVLHSNRLSTHESRLHAFQLVLCTIRYRARIDLGALQKCQKCHVWWNGLPLFELLLLGPAVSSCFRRYRMYLHSRKEILFSLPLMNICIYIYTYTCLSLSLYLSIHI